MNLIKIPRNIFQTWSTKEFSDGFKTLIDTWKEKNPNYAYFLFDDNDCDEFIRTNFHEKVYNTYCKIIPGAFKADLWRCCVLYVYGGVYIDVDTICLESIDNFLNKDIEFMTPIDLNNCSKIGTHNLFNCFIASIPKHPILLECINRIVHNVENNIVPFSNLDFTGPGILGRATNVYLNLDEETSFIGKEGLHDNSIYLLKFECNTEYVKNEHNNILFQNKNGNSTIQELYKEEIKGTNHIDWGKCTNPIKQVDVNNVSSVTDKKMNAPTIVTMFYNIREKEGNKYSESKLNHSVNRYFDFAKKFILTLPYNLMVFTDCAECIDMVKTERENYKNQTYICNKKFEDTHFYKYLERLEDLQKKYPIYNANLEHETPMYIILNNNKFDFMETAINLNPFDSSHFIWMDFGINHVALNMEKIDDWFYEIPNKIKQLCINPYIENVENKSMFHNIYHHMAGGFFTGSKENLMKYIDLFKLKTQQIYDEEWYQIDEAVMTMVQRENPDLFELFYGDYNGIISNYVYPIHNIELILQGSQKCIDSNKTKQAYHILCYCLKYFEMNINHHLIYYYIQQHIIVDYYNNNKELIPGVIRLIQKHLEDDDKNMNKLIENNLLNINYYENKNLIISEICE